MVVYVSLGALQMIDYIATHSVVRDGIHNHSKTGAGWNTGSHEGKRLPKCDLDGPSWNRKFSMGFRKIK